MNCTGSREIAVLAARTAPAGPARTSPVLPSNSTAYWPSMRTKCRSSTFSVRSISFSANESPHRQVDLLVLAEVLDFGLQPEVELGQPLRHLEFERRFAVFEQLEIRHLLRRRHAVQIGRRDHQPHVLQHRQRDRDAVQVQLRPDHHLGLVAGQQRFAVDVDAGGQGVVFRLVLELVQRAEIAVRQDDLLLATERWRTERRSGPCRWACTRGRRTTAWRRAACGSVRPAP